MNEQQLSAPGTLPAVSPALNDDASRRSTDCAEFLRALHPAGTFEIRAFDCPVNVGSTYKRTASGFYGDVEQAAAACATIEAHKPPGVYVTMNPVKHDLLALANHRIEWQAKNTTTDADIECRRWLLVDLDPVRKSGISSTDAEMQAALELGCTIRNALDWPSPIFGMSGNGCYLLYRIDLPNDAASTELVKAVLKNLAERFDTPEVKIDRKTFNAARIIKVLGTMVRKGDET